MADHKQTDAFKIIAAPYYSLKSQVYVIIRKGFKMQILLLFFSMVAFSLAAQQTTDSEYVKPIKSFRWVDGNHYLSYYAGGVRRSPIEKVINAATGEEESIAKAETRPARYVLLKRNDMVIIKRRDEKTDTLTGIKNPEFSPDSTQLAYTKNNDLYTLDLETNKEWQITNDGSQTIYNGFSSWVYNEEILGRATAYRAFWWAPDSRHIAFMHFDDTNVPVYTMVDDKGTHQKMIDLHYPLPGDANPEVKIGIAETGNKRLTWADFDEKKDQYFGTPLWTPASELWVQWMNRRQDTLKVEAVNILNGTHKNIYTESQNTWVALDQENRITFVPSKNMFLLMSDKSGWMHIYAYTMDGKPIVQLTSGDWTVTEINRIDDKNGFVYFTARKENSTRLDFYKVPLKGGNVQRLTFGDYMHRIQLSPNGDYFITTYGNFETPTRVALLSNSGKIIRQLEDSKGKDYVKLKLSKPTSIIFRISTAAGFNLPVRITFPAHLDTTKKYPLMANIYGGPGSLFVQDGFYDFSADTSDMIRIQMDHRGSGHFGKQGEDYLYRQLGKWEIEDYSTVIKYLERKYPFIDSSRIGITGFSYGGYVTCLALTKAADVFTVGLAGGSVTDWRLYDSHYTERYMGTPKDNPEGYKNASVMTYAKNYKGHLRLAQGTMDDNVHMQNTMQLVDALQNTGKHFELMYYIGAAHGWYFMRDKAMHSQNDENLFIRKYLFNKNKE